MPAAQLVKTGSLGALYLTVFSPVDGQRIASVIGASEADYETAMTAATAAFPVWRQMPAPFRGEIVRQFGNKLRDFKITVRTIGVL